MSAPTVARPPTHHTVAAPRSGGRTDREAALGPNARRERPLWPTVRPPAAWGHAKSGPNRARATSAFPRVHCPAVLGAPLGFAWGVSPTMFWPTQVAMACPSQVRGSIMRLAVVARCAACVAIATVGSATAEDADYGQPSCIASTLPAAQAQVRLIPAEIKGTPLAQVRGVVVRALTWKRGETIKVCFHGGTRKAQERVARIASEWMQYANVLFDFEEGGAPRLCQGGGGSDIKIAFEDNKGWWSVPGTSSRSLDPSMNLQFYGVDTPMLANGQPFFYADTATT